jgi:hypothetical protein
MAETPKIETIFVEEGFPPTTLPTFFCDGIANLAPSAQVMQFGLQGEAGQFALQGKDSNARFR